jgi:hypothetical protein
MRSRSDKVAPHALPVGQGDGVPDLPAVIVLDPIAVHLGGQLRHEELAGVHLQPAALHVR